MTYSFLSKEVAYILSKVTIFCEIYLEIVSKIPNKNRKLLDSKIEGKQ